MSYATEQAIRDIRDWLYAQGNYTVQLNEIIEWLKKGFIIAFIGVGLMAFYKFYKMRMF